MREITIPVILKSGDDLVLGQEHWVEYSSDIDAGFGFLQVFSVSDLEAEEDAIWVLIARPEIEGFESTNLTVDDYESWKNKKEADNTAEVAEEVDTNLQAEAAARAKSVLDEINLDPDDLKALLFGALNHG